MKHINTVWTIKELVDLKKQINPRPQYQRTPVWTIERKCYLIDSILRNYDLPKFYVKTNPKGSAFQFEVADGQQRMRAIWEFFDGNFVLHKNSIINKIDISELTFNQLPNILKEQFLKYTLSFTEILQESPGEMNELFKRLQRGVTLNPPELRHAMYSQIGFYVSNFLEKPSIQEFFTKSKIKDTRFKYQEYVDNVITLIHYKNKKDLKAGLMSQLYIDFEDSNITEFKAYFLKTEQVLKSLTKINEFRKGLFKNKWAFVDYFWLLYKNYNSISTLQHEKFADLAFEFENNRLKYNSKPETLLKLKRNKFGQKLYNYIQAFNKEGAKKENINIRNLVLEEIFKSQFNK